MKADGGVLSPGGLHRARADIEGYAAGNPDIGIADLELAVAGHGLVGFGTGLAMR
jgi:hypothetical protein